MFHLVVGSSYTSKDDWNTGERDELGSRHSEEEAAALDLAQTIAALGSLAKDGCMAQRVGNQFEHSSIGLMYLLNCTFSEVRVCKPVAAMGSSEEVWLVCLSFKGISQAHLDKLLQAVGPVPPKRDDTALTLMPKSFIPPAWMEQMRTCGTLFARLQISVMHRDQNLFEMPSDRQEIYSQRDRVAQSWRVKFKCRSLDSLNDRVVRDVGRPGREAAAATITTNNPGGRLWYSQSILVPPPSTCDRLLPCLDMDFTEAKGHCPSELVFLDFSCR